jgi:hypothetical protein
MSKQKVVVYGASGYTGRLVCEYLRELNIPFIAAGRNAKRIQEVMNCIPGIETANYRVVEVKHEVDALAKLFDQAEVVCNMVGPFIKLGQQVVEACLKANCHYLDTTGEQDWLLYAQSEWGDKFVKQKLLLSPGIAHMYTTGEIAANICLETPGVDTLDILTLWKGLPTISSTQTIFTILKANWYYLEENKLVEWKPGQSYEANVPGQHEQTLVLPWGGTSHPVWFEKDPRVATCKVLGGVFSREVMQGVIEAQKMIEDKIKTLPLSEQENALSAIASSVQGSMPPRENPRINKSVDSVYASGPLTRVHCVIYGNCNYKQTGLLQAYAARSLLMEKPKRIGFASACQAFGHRNLLGILRNFGLVMNPVVTIQD